MNKEVMTLKESKEIYIQENLEEGKGSGNDIITL